jgi:diguanylate cyclase (GGDEF)-like protein/PAS domain S-box-containing protein
MRGMSLNFRCLWGRSPHKHLKFKAPYILERLKGRMTTQKDPTVPTTPGGLTEAHYRDLFEFAPISLWEEDYSQVKCYLNKLRKAGVTDLHVYLDEHPEVVTECMACIVVLDVNRKTLELFGASDQAHLVANLNRIFRDDMRLHFQEELLDMWAGRLSYEREGVNYSLNGTAIDINLHWTALPGYEESLERVLVSITDITARKKAERYLTYLGTHDVLTGLYNRAFFEEERERLENGRRFPVSILICDLDGLKVVNDTYGHAAGDELLRRAAEVIKTSFRTEDVVARLGGDEFGIILAETNESTALSSIERIHQLIEMNNNFYQGPRLAISIGSSTGEKGTHLVDIQRMADDRMYQAKRQRNQVGSRTNKSYPP